MASEFLEGLFSLGAGVARGYRTKKTDEEKAALKREMEQMQADLRREQIRRMSAEDRWQEEVARARAQTYQQGTEQSYDARLRGLEQGLNIALMRDLTTQRGQDIRSQTAAEAEAGRGERAQLYEGGRESRAAQREQGVNRRFDMLYGQEGVLIDPKTGKRLMRGVGSAAMGAAGRLSYSMQFLKQRLLKRYGRIDPTIGAFFDEAVQDPSLEQEVMETAQQAADEYEAAGKPRPSFDNDDFMGQVVRYVKQRREQNRQRMDFIEGLNQINSPQGLFTPLPGGGPSQGTPAPSGPPPNQRPRY